MYSKMNDNKVFTRTNSICPAPEEILKELVLSNDTNKLEIFNINEKLQRHIYEDYNKPILLVACIEKFVEPQTVQILLQSIQSPDILQFSDEEDQWEALHFAAKRTNYHVLKLIVGELKKYNIDINNVLAQGSNALHVLIRFGDKDLDEFVPCARLLIEEGINVNCGDNKSMTPILWAAKNGLKDIVTAILKYSYVPVDIDSHTYRGQSAREIITNKNLYDEALPEKNDNNNQSPVYTEENTAAVANVLFEYIKSKRENDFINFNDGNIKDFVNLDDTNNTLLQMACKKCCKKIVEHLINNGADQNADRLVNVKNKSTPLEIAAECGFYEIFAFLLHNLRGSIPKNVFISLLRDYDNEIFDDVDKKRCCNILLKKLSANKNLLDINEGDQSKNSPLHYAIRYGDHNVINKLLDIGASLGSKNDNDIMPIQYMEPELLKAHLDDCVHFDCKGKKDKEDFSITFKYDTLIPPPKQRKNVDPETANFTPDDRELVHETEVIAYMSATPEFKHLLTHPVIVSFLFMKWHRIRLLFYTNLIFYIAFFASLVTYIFSYYANFAEEHSSFQEFLKWSSWLILLVTFIVLIFRELFQIVILPNKYFRDFENYIEIILILISGCILFINSPSVNTRKQLSSLAMLLAAFELVLMVGQHPKLSTNVVMLKTVSYNFFKFLLWYSLLLVAFALSFYILFTTTGPTQSSTNQTDIEDDQDSFADPGKSVFKTIVMLTGEFDASDINFETFPIVSKLIFVLFIFMIAIILLNLLNGLAVSDTQMIKNDAELLGHISRAQHIRYVEGLLLGNIAPNNMYKKISDICCCLPFASNRNISIFKPLATRVCLFPYLFDYEITVYPNRSGEILISKNKRQKCCYGCCYNFHLDKETVKRINELVQEKKDQTKLNIDNGKIENEIAAIKKQLEELLYNFNKMSNHSAN